NNIAFCVITGGPGVGKTLIQKAILEIFTKQHPSAPILCCSPTGKAARRMTESTGYPAQTVHSALGLMANEMGDFNDPIPLEAELIVVDECSMLDTFIAASLFDAINNGCRVIFVGDQDQLPSVGAGCVLADLLSSGHIPFVKLNAVFRQAKGSPIAVNAAAMNKGSTELVFDDDFKFIPSSDIDKSVEILVHQYLTVAKELGPDSVALLSPFRRSTETGVNALNKRLQQEINPPDDSKNEVAYNGMIFREGDRVMQIKNFKNVANGDIGRIQRIFEREDEGVKELIVSVEFSDTSIEYSREDLKMLDLAFCTTVHKSQGSEYHTIILTLQRMHSIMLNRPLIYTAITRGKKRVIIVGEREAVNQSILTNDTQKRNTCLKERIQARFDR
ncbi:MAG: AAA family ATPase, partial [Acutalibacteraceae bacterium]|nr:AAA family ATPase [Acutalibacteraceae bacterium]